jgi:hypothetical protein
LISNENQEFPVGNQTIPSSDIIINLLDCIPPRIKLSLDLKNDNKYLFDIFARLTNPKCIDELDITSYPKKGAIFKFLPLKRVRNYQIFDFSLQISQLEEMLEGTESLFFQNANISLDLARSNKFRQIKTLIFDSCRMIGSNYS